MRRLSFIVSQLHHHQVCVTETGSQMLSSFSLLWFSIYEEVACSSVNYNSCSYLSSLKSLTGLYPEQTQVDAVEPSAQNCTYNIYVNGEAT